MLLNLCIGILNPCLKLEMAVFWILVVLCDINMILHLTWLLGWLHQSQILVLSTLLSKGCNGFLWFQIGFRFTIKVNNCLVFLVFIMKWLHFIFHIICIVNPFGLHLQLQIPKINMECLSFFGIDRLHIKLSTFDLSQILLYQLQVFQPRQSLLDLFLF